MLFLYCINYYCCKLKKNSILLVFLYKYFSLHVFVVLLALHPESVLYGDLVGASSSDPLLGVCLVY